MAAIVTTPTLPFDVGGGIEDAFSELNLFLLDQSCDGGCIWPHDGSGEKSWVEDESVTPVSSTVSKLACSRRSRMLRSKCLVHFFFLIMYLHVPFK